MTDHIIVYGYRIASLFLQGKENLCGIFCTLCFHSVYYMYKFQTYHSSNNLTPLQLIY